MNESTLGVHEIELVVDTRKDFRDGRGVADHAASAHHLCQIAARHHRWWLIVDATLEPSWAPINELDRPFRLDGCHRGIHVLQTSSQATLIRG